MSCYMRSHYHRPVIWTLADFDEPCRSCLGYTNTLPKNIEATVEAGHKISTKDSKQICFEQPI